MGDKKRITARLLEAHFSAMPILIEYVKSVKTKKAAEVLAKWDKARGYERMTPDSSEVLFGFVAYLLKYPEALKEKDPDQLKRNLAILAEKFRVVNDLAGPFPGYHERLVMPHEGVEDARKEKVH